MNQTTTSVASSTATTTTTKAYKCDSCDAAFTEKMYLDMHKQIHQKEFPLVQIVMNPASTQVIPQPSPAHQGTAQIVIQEDQLAAYKRAYGMDPQQVYTLAPVTQYQVITNNRNGTQSVQNQVNIPTYSTPTYVVATADGHQIHGLPETIIQHEHDQHNHNQQQQLSQHHTHHQQNDHLEQDPLIVQQVQPQHIIPIRIGRSVVSNQKDRPYKCDQCTATFIESSELEEHKKKHTGEGPFTCDDCHFTFMYKSHFKSHKTRCMKRRAMMPPNAPKVIVNPAPVKRQFPTNHIQQQKHQQSNQQHQQMQASPAYTKIYTQTFNSKSIPIRQGTKTTSQNKFNPNNPSFKRIKKECRLDRPHECDECDASFQSEVDLRSHKTKHTGEGPFKCEECRFVFLYRKLYDAHRKRCEKKRREMGLPVSTITCNDEIVTSTHQNSSSIANLGSPQQITQIHQLHPQHQEVNMQGGQTITTTSVVPTSLASVLSNALQMHNISGQPTIIEMRPTNSQGQEIQHIQIPHPLLEQVLVSNGTTVTGIGGGRHDIKYEIVPIPAGLVDSPDGINVNQIMNLIKVKGPNQ